MVLAQPVLKVDAAASQHPISPDIYGINGYQDKGLGSEMRLGVRRWGGDATTRYSWKVDTFNSGSDYYFHNFPYSNDPSSLPNGSEFDRFIESNNQGGVKTIGTVPMVGWTAKSRDATCSFSVAKYGAQKEVDQYAPDCGKGVLLNGTQIKNDPTDTSVPIDEMFATEWVRHLVSRYGPGNQGGVAIWDLDNEPVWWFGVHVDVHPNPQTYDETRDLGFKYAAAIKDADPTALTAGPVSAGWESMFFSALDLRNGWNTAPYMYWDNPVDRNAHGGMEFSAWYLQQMKQYETQHGRRILDYFDLHAYIAPSGVSFGTGAGDATMQALRLKSTRAFWDANYSALQPDNNQPPRLIPRMHDWVNQNYPGTKLAITEYNWGAMDDITGALAQADLLGIFGREGLDLATLWGPPDPAQPGTFAFRMFLNYDGLGSRFGETSVSAASTDPDTLSMFAARRADSALTVLVINKTTGDVADTLALANFSATGTAQAFRYSAANLNAIVRQPDVSVTSTIAFPAYSMTLLVIPATTNAPKPVVKALVNAASYDTAVAPGEIVTLFGDSLGPAVLQRGTVDSSGLVATSLSGVRVLFNGVPAPIVYASAGQTAVVVPYTAALQTMASVQAEVQGVRSDALSVAIGAAGPGVFILSGTQGAILNQDGTINSVANPAARGTIVSIYATGEGQTNPPGVDGKFAASILPKPLLAVTATIGGLPATVLYAGAAPGNLAGLMQVNAKIPDGAVPGGAVAVQLSVGTNLSKSGATVAVR